MVSILVSNKITDSIQGAGRYNADITAGSLKIHESRIIADLLLRQTGEREWIHAIQTENVLQARSPATAKRIARLLRNRLSLMAPDLWRFIRDGSMAVATQACLAAAIKHSALLGDFLDSVVREQYRLFAPNLSVRLWEDYISGCRDRDPEMSEWSESTIARLRSSVFQILAQGGYIENTRIRKLQTVHISEEIIQHLLKQDEHYILRCIQVSP